MCGKDFGVNNTLLRIPLKTMHLQFEEDANPPPAPPTKEEIRAARKAAGITQAEAANLIHHKLRNWQRWEYGENTMHPALWELFRLKASR
jgi:DNA-binding transcriptional regulator YiaG